MKEVKACRYAGPYKDPPFEHYIQSPIGLVPKDQGKKTRLIFHLSHPRKGNSVNTCIPAANCTVRYPDFKQVIQLCLQATRNGQCVAGKSDMSMTFRHIPLKKSDWPLLILKAQHPETNIWYYFVDKCLPFGAAISCALFQAFSDSVSHLVEFKTKRKNINYLDDFFFAAWINWLCNQQVNTFIQVCEDICFPVSIEKTYWATVRLTFLGLLIDLQKKLVCIPGEKIIKAVELIAFFINGVNKKCTVLQLQELTGFLNFLCKVIIPGRAFLRRLYTYVSSTMLQHHHIRITQEMRKDLMVWRTFLMHPSIFSRPFMDVCPLSAVDINMYSDAAKSELKGMGVICQNDWMYMKWNPEFIRNQDPSIEFLELYAVTAAVLTWIHRFKNKRVYLFCDNMSVVHMINNSTSSCVKCMTLI